MSKTGYFYQNMQVMGQINSMWYFLGIGQHLSYRLSILPPIKADK